MITEIHDAQVYSVRVVSARKVVFTFDLRDNENMRDPDVIRRSMAQYMLAYPRVDRYSAEYLGDWLVLTVVGTISLQAVDMYI